MKFDIIYSMAEIGAGPEIVLPPNPNYGKERTQLVSNTTEDLHRRAAALAGNDDFSVIKGPGGFIIRDGVKIMIPKNKVLVRDGWEGITDPAKIEKYRRITAGLLAEQRAARKQKRK